MSGQQVNVMPNKAIRKCCIPWNWGWLCVTVIFLDYSNLPYAQAEGWADKGKVVSLKAAFALEGSCFYMPETFCWCPRAP